MRNPDQVMSIDQYLKFDKLKVALLRPARWARFQDDPHHDREAILASQRALEKYGTDDPARENSYPRHVLRADYTGLPTHINGLLDPTSPPLNAETAAEAAQAWLAQPLISRALYGLDWETAQTRLRPGTTEVVSMGQTYGEGSNRHVFFQQMNGAVPVYGGQVVVHLTEGTRRVSATCSYFPLTADANLKPPENWADARTRALQAARQKLEAYLPPAEHLSLYWGLLAPALAQADVHHRLDEAQTDQLKALLAGLAHTEALRELDVETLLDLIRRGDAATALAQLRGLRRAQAQEQARFDVAPYEGSLYFIFPFEGKYHMSMRVIYQPTQGRASWQVFVETSEWQVLGEPQPLVLGTPQFFPHADDVEGNRLVPAPDWDATLGALGAFARYAQANGSTVTSADGNNLALVNVAVHAVQFFEHFTTTLRVAPATLKSYIYFQWEPPMDDFGTGSYTPTLIPRGLQLQVGSYGAQLVMGFDASTNPKQITFQTDEKIKDDEDKTVRNPSLDPEVIYHEMAHGLMWLLNRSPFDQHSEHVPFWRALVEGYATYYARSFAERAASAAGVVNPDQKWATWAYPQEEFEKENALSRQDTIDGEDRLALPNLYPAVSTTGSPMYRVSMIWARALWDVRTRLGADAADRLALNAFMHLSGWVANYEQAAEALIDEIARELGANAPVIPLIKEDLRKRGIYAEQGAQALTRVQVAGNDVILVGGDAGVYQLNRSNKTWGTPALKNVVALATDPTSNVVYAATENQIYQNANPPLANGWMQLGNFPTAGVPLCILVHGGNVYVGAASGVYRADPSNPAWRDWNSNLAATFYDVAFDLAVGTMSGNNHAILFAASLDDTVRATALTVPAGNGVVSRPAPGKWLGLGTIAPGARVTAVAFLNDTLYAGTLAQGIYRAQNLTYDPAQDSLNTNNGPVRWDVMAPQIPAGQAILRLMADPAGGRLLAATRAGLFVHDAQASNSGWKPLPNGPGGAMVTDLLPDGNFPIVASYDQGAMWRAQSGTWQSLLFI